MSELEQAWFNLVQSKLSPVLACKMAPSLSKPVHTRSVTKWFKNDFRSDTRPQHWPRQTIAMRASKMGPGARLKLAYHVEKMEVRGIFRVLTCRPLDARGFVRKRSPTVHALETRCCHRIISSKAQSFLQYIVKL